MVKLRRMREVNHEAVLLAMGFKTFASKEIILRFHFMIDFLSC